MAYFDNEPKNELGAYEQWTPEARKNWRDRYSVPYGILSTEQEDTQELPKKRDHEEN